MPFRVAVSPFGLLFGPDFDDSVFGLGSFYGYSIWGDHRGWGYIQNLRKDVLELLGNHCVHHLGNLVVN